MFGGLKAKLGGLRHIYVHYLGKPPQPEDIKLYEPYNNRECLHSTPARARSNKAHFRPCPNGGHQIEPDLVCFERMPPDGSLRGHT
jgi:hypothetical protein